MPHPTFTVRNNCSIAEHSQVRADRIGTYFLAVTYRGADPIWIDGVLNTGTTIMGAPYAMVVTPGPAKAEWSTAYGDGLLNTTVGEFGYFWVTSRDRFGNRCDPPHPVA